MKKSLVLAMAMALGVTASAYAANPFSDVPAGHWAYDSISKLAAAGVIEGYPDGSFKGDNLMTRYEMAQIVAKAMAKGANVDALAAEFADELDNLGVRVAALEKKSDNVKITGEARYRYVSYHGKDKDNDNDLRTRLYITGQVNDDWSYHAMLQNEQDFKDDAGNENTSFKEAYAEGKLGGLSVIAGRYNPVIAGGNVMDVRVDGVELSYGDKIKLTGFVGKAEEEGTPDVPTKYVAAEVSTDFGKLIDVYGGVAFFNGNHRENKVDNDIWHIGAKFNFGNVELNGTYLYGKYQADGQKDSTDGYVIGATYKGAEVDAPGSWGLFANYYNQAKYTYVAHTTDAESFGWDQGFKGFGVGANYAVAKNIVATVAYYDTENKSDSSDKRHILWSDVTFTF